MPYTPSQDPGKNISHLSRSKNGKKMSQKQRVAAGLNMARKAGADLPAKEGTLFLQGLVGYDAQGRLLKTFNSMKEAFEFATEKNFKEVVDVSKGRRYV
jgi:hypothetical protein